MFNSFSGSDANSVWKMAADTLISGDSTSQMTRLGESKELMHASFQISDPRQRWITARTPAISPAFAIAEVFWILNGDNNAEFMNFWNPGLPKYAGSGNTYHGAYGYRIKKQFGLDQLDAAYQALSNNPVTRQVVIQIWDPRTDLPNCKGEPAAADIPCNICSMPKIRNNKLEWLQVMRSNDVFLGMPYNIIQFTTLQEILAGWLNLELGAYFQISDSLHAYTHDLDQYSLDHERESIKNTDNWALCKRDSDEVISSMYSRLRVLASNKLAPADLSALISANSSSMPEGYANLFCISCAYAARKRGWWHEMHGAIELCRNQALVNIWNLWLAKKQGVGNAILERRKA